MDRLDNRVPSRIVRIPARIFGYLVVMTVRRDRIQRLTSLALLLIVAVVSAAACDGHGRRGYHRHHRGLQEDRMVQEVQAVAVATPNHLGDVSVLGLAVTGETS